MTEQLNKFYETFLNGYEGEPDETKELTPEMLRDFSLSYDKKFSRDYYDREKDNFLTKDRLNCFEIMKRILEEEKDSLTSFLMNKLPHYFEDVKKDSCGVVFSQQARSYDEVVYISEELIKFHGSYRCGRCSGGCGNDQDYDIDIPTEFFLDPNGPEKRKEFFKLEKQKATDKKLKEQQEAIAKQEAQEKQILAKLQEKYKNNP